MSYIMPFFKEMNILNVNCVILAGAIMNPIVVQGGYRCLFAGNGKFELWQTLWRGLLHRHTVGRRIFVLLFCVCNFYRNVKLFYSSTFFCVFIASHSSKQL